MVAKETSKDKKFRIELICVGDELLSGITMNTNAHWLALEIAKLGGSLGRITVVGDKVSEIASIIQEAIARKPSMILVTGGLGATYDDLTLEGLASAVGKKLALDERAVLMLKKSYSRRRLQYQLTKPRLKMAMIPEGSVPIQNLEGSAPGVRMSVGQTEIFCMQGVPREMQAIFRKNIVPIIKKTVGPFSAIEQNYEVEGVSEAMLAPALVRIVDSFQRDELYLKTHPRGYNGTNPKLRIQIVCRGARAARVKKLLRTISALILREVSMLSGTVCTKVEP